MVAANRARTGRVYWYMYKSMSGFRVAGSERQLASRTQLPSRKLLCGGALLARLGQGFAGLSILGVGC